MVAILPLLHFLLKYGKTCISEFSLLWSTDPHAKSLSFFQLTLALVTTDQFKGNGQKVRESGEKLLVTIILLTVLVSTIRFILPIVEEEMKKSSIGTDVIITKEELEKTSMESQLRNLIQNNSGD